MVRPCSVFWRYVGQVVVAVSDMVVVVWRVIVGPEGDARQWQWPGDYDTEWWTRTGSVMGAANGWGYKWWQP